MANKIITFVIDTFEQELDSVLAAAINELHSLGHSVKEIRVTDDTGETKVPTNTVAGVTVHEPVPQNVTPVETAPAPEPAPEPTPDPTPDTPTGEGSSTDTPPVDTPPTPTA